MCGGGPSFSPPPPVQRQPALQAAVKAQPAGLKKRTTRQTTTSAIGTPKPSVLSGAQGLGDELLNLGGKTILGG